MQAARDPHDHADACASNPPMAVTVRELHDRLERARATLPAGVRAVLERLQSAGFQAYLAGGYVRDVLLERPADDYDVATSARPEQVIPLFRRVIPTGVQHGTVTVLTDRDGPAQVEVTTFRGEGAYVDGRRPESVEFLEDIDRDLARRDFTINAIAWDPIRSDLRDPFGGIGDVARRRVRAVGDPVARLSEDGLRSMRAVRFASTLRFGLDSATKQAIAETIATFRRVAMERVRDEFVKLLLRSEQPSRGIELLFETRLLHEFLPELLEGRGLRQNQWHRWDVWKHTLHVLDFSAPRLVVRLSALLHDIAKPRCAVEVSPGERTFHRHEFVGAELATVILERLKLPRKAIDAVSHQVREHNWHFLPEWNDATVRRHLAQLGEDALDDFFALREADLKGRGRAVPEGLRNLAELRARIEIQRARAHALTIQDLAVTGADVMAALEVGPGRLVGDTLKALLHHVLDVPEDNTRERLLERIRERREPPVTTP